MMNELTRKLSQEMHTGGLCDLLAGLSNALVDPFVNFTFDEGNGAATDFNGGGKALLAHKAINPSLAIASSALNF